TWCREEFLAHGLEGDLVQCSVSFNKKSRTLRGLHYQAPPAAEAKLVRCCRGALYDVAVDLRPDSPTFRGWLAVELTEDDGRPLSLPRGFAHGFYPLADSTEVLYQMSAPYRPQSARGLRWDDPFIGVSWPGPVAVLAPRDRNWPDADESQLQELRGLCR